MASAIVPTQTIISPPPINFSDYHSAYLPLPVEHYPVPLQQTVANMRRMKESDLNNIFELLGKGVAGTVYRGIYQKKGVWSIACAVKVFDDLSQAKEEANMLWKSSGSPHTIRFHGFQSIIAENGVEKRAVVTDLAQGLQLSKLSFAANLLVSKRQEIISIFKQLLEFLVGIQTADVHRPNPLIHGDLAPDNLFWDSRNLTVIDFSLVGEKGDTYIPVIQKTAVRAPEIFLNQVSEENKRDEVIRYSESVDIWSVGMIVHELVIGRPIISWNKRIYPHGQEEISVLVSTLGMPPSAYLDQCVATAKYFDKAGGKYILKPAIAAIENNAKSFAVLHSLSVGSCPPLFDLLKYIFVWEPEKRLTPTQALQHSLFK